MFRFFNTSLFFLLISLNSFSQESEVNYVEIDWKVGTKKTITQIDSSYVYFGDSLFTSIGVKSKYNLEVVSLKDSIYEVKFNALKIDTTATLKSELIDTKSIEAIYSLLMREMNEEMKYFEYTLLVDQYTGQAYDIKNKNEYSEFLHRTVPKLINTLAMKFGKEIGVEEEKKMEKTINEAILKLLPGSIQTVINIFNYTFQSYSMPYQLGETYIVETEIYDVNAMREDETILKTDLLINSRISNGKLEMECIYDYDLQESYNTLVISKGKQEEIAIEEFDVSEKIVTKFTLATSWITSSVKYVYVKMGDITSIQNSYIIIE